MFGSAAVNPARPVVNFPGRHGQAEGVLWTYPADGLRTTRDGNILSNGNVLLTTVETGGTDNTAEDDRSALSEATPDGKIVWRLRLAGIPVVGTPGWFLKAERITY